MVKAILFKAYCVITATNSSALRLIFKLICDYDYIIVEREGRRLAAIMPYCTKSRRARTWVQKTL